MCKAIMKHLTTGAHSVHEFNALQLQLLLHYLSLDCTRSKYGKVERVDAVCTKRILAGLSNDGLFWQMSYALLMAHTSTKLVR